MSIGAIILAGGASRRMGQPKALVRPDPGGPCLIELVIAAVRPLITEGVISTNAPASYDWLDWPTVGDEFRGAGPLAGLAAGLTVSTTDAAFLLGCDMPHIATGLLRYFVMQLDDQTDAVVPLNQAGFPEPLCAIYRTTIGPQVHAYLAAGHRAARGFLTVIRTRFVAVAESIRYDPDLRSFDNWNTLVDLPNHP